MEIGELSVAAHRYRTRWGVIRSVEDRATEIGRIPRQRLILRAGTPRGHLTLESVHEAAWRASPGREDVVRTAGFAFGLGCHYRIVVRGFGAGGANVRAFVGPLPASDPIHDRSTGTQDANATGPIPHARMDRENVSSPSASPDQAPSVERGAAMGRRGPRPTAVADRGLEPGQFAGVLGEPGTSHAARVDTRP